MRLRPTTQPPRRRSGAEPRFFEGKEQRWKADYEDPGFIDRWQVDWANFVSEYPDVELGDCKEWTERLGNTVTLSPDGERVLVILNADPAVKIFPASQLLPVVG